MNTAPTILHFVLTALAAGVLGGAAMEFVMWLFSRAEWAKGSMIVALGSLITKARENAWRTGAVLHTISAVVFAMIYTLVLRWLGYTHLPQAMMLGLGLGFFQGLVVSLTLVWIVSEWHPLEEFNDAGLAVGLSHLMGHVVYGGVVGVVVGLSSL